MALSETAPSEYQLGNLEWAVPYLNSITTEIGIGTWVGDQLERHTYSKYGLHMAEQPLRFAMFEHGTRAEMIQERGIDVHPIGHQYAAAIYGARICLADIDSIKDQIGLEGIKVFLFGLGSHDNGEDTHEDLRKKLGFVVGDIPMGQKTDTDRWKEKRIRAEKWRELYPHILPGVIATIEDFICHKDPGINGQLYEASHDTLSLETAVVCTNGITTRMKSHIQTRSSPSELLTMAEYLKQSSAIAQDVTKNLLPTYLNEHAQRFTYCANYLSQRLFPIMSPRAYEPSKFFDTREPDTA